MADNFESRYVLRRIRSSTRQAADLAKGLIIYHSYTPRLEATNTNEIQYWCDKYTEQLEDEFYLFVLDLNGEIVGFAQAVLFVAEQFVALDYMTLRDQNRSAATFLTFYELIRSYCEAEGAQFNYFIAELLQETEGVFTVSSEFWRSIMALERFRVIDAPFRQLQLGRTKFETNVPSRIIIDVGSDVRTLPRDSYVMIIRALVLRHYLRWYVPFLGAEEYASYETAANELLKRICNEVRAGDLPLSTINGTMVPVAPMLGSYKSNTRLIAYESMSYIVLLAVLVTARVALSLGATEILLLAVGALLVRLALLSVFVPEASASLHASLSALSLLLGKKNSVARKRSKKP